MPTLSIIILSYNTKDLLRLCLVSVFEKIRNIPLEVIVVDNASSDDSVGMVKKEFSKVRLVESKENTGFARGCNLGASVAKGKYLLFLNSDAEILEFDFEKIFKHFQEDEKTAIIGGLLENRDGTMQRSYGEFYDLPAVFRMLFRGDASEIKKKDLSGKSEVDWVSGGFMVVKKDVFDMQEGFDEHFFMYIEDMEFCYRVRKEGIGVLVDPDMKVRHVGQGSSNRKFAIVHIYRGLDYFYSKHRSFAKRVILRKLLYTKALMAMFIGVLQGNRQLVSTYKSAIRF